MDLLACTFLRLVAHHLQVEDPIRYHPHRLGLFEQQRQYPETAGEKKDLCELTLRISCISADIVPSCDLLRQAPLSKRFLSCELRLIMQRILQGRSYRIGDTPLCSWEGSF